ncbi:MAG: hypothetical protein JJ899_08805 [Alphaproteobacteria bacterium]|nr:hypothetical protein [Alphaproteobacteria bacterium]
MKFILFNLVVTGALVFLVFDKGGAPGDMPGPSEIAERVEGLFEGKPDAVPALPAALLGTTAPVEAALGDDLAPLPEPRPEPEPGTVSAPTAVAPVAASPVPPAPPEPPAEEILPLVPAEKTPVPETPAPASGPVMVAEAPPPGLAPDVAKRRAEVLGTPQRTVRPAVRLSESAREALAERRLRLERLAEEMELMSAEATLR